MEDIERYGLSGGPYLSKKDMADLLVTAWEGGSNHWIEEAEIMAPKGMTYQDLKRAAWDAAPEDERHLWREEGRDGRWPLYSMLAYLPPSVAWKIRFKEKEEGGESFLTPQNMREALGKLAKAYPDVVARIKDEEYDALDADAWLQTAALGEVVYG